MTFVADLFDTMAYGPAPEADAPVREWLERHQLGTFGHFIDGAFAKHGKTFAVNNPATGSLLANVDDSALASLMAEVSAPALQRTVLRLSLAAARADGNLADGEIVVLEAVRHHWRLADGDEASGPTSERRHAA